MTSPAVEPAAAGRAQLAVLGHPIAHSKSPQIHRAAYRELGLDWEYTRHDTTVDTLPSVLAAQPWRGLSLTMPLKERAREIARWVDPAARKAGGVNTLLRDGDDWLGWNTDIPGLAAVIREAACSPEHTLILGTGATAVSAAFAALAAGAERLTVAGRRPDAARAVCERCEPELLASTPGNRHAAAAVDLNDSAALTAQAARATLVISTLPGPVGSTLTLPEQLCALPLIDVAYDPWPSPLAERWQRHGGDTISGLEMLLQQALLQVRIFVGGSADTPVAREREVFAAMRRAAQPVAGMER